MLYRNPSKGSGILAAVFVTALFAGIAALMSTQNSQLIATTDNFLLASDKRNLRIYYNATISCSKTKEHVSSCAKGKKISLFDAAGNVVIFSDNTVSELGNYRIYALCGDKGQVEIEIENKKGGRFPLYSSATPFPCKI